MNKIILIVDDEPDVSLLLKIRIEHAGYSTMVAGSAEEALALIKKNIPDLILLDLLLPKMRGEEACRILKLDGGLKNIPVIILSASAACIVEKVKEACADDYILKPFEPGELLFKIKKFIG